MATISTHNGSQVSQQHNLRNRKVTDKEEHIDKDGIHETWVHETQRQAYHRLFDEAQAAYNAKQRRADRKIDNYYQQVKSSNKQHTAYEMIIGIYGNEDTKTCKEIMKEFVDTWQQRNPNLELIGAYYHADEQGEPHCHIDYIPVAHGYKRGMETQAGLVKAFEEMGYQAKGKATAQILWEADQNQYLENLCKERNIKIEHPQKDNVHHLETKLFKAEKQIEDLSKELENKNKELEATNKQLEEVLDMKVKASEIKKPLFSKETVVCDKQSLDKVMQIGAEASRKLTEAQKLEKELTNREEQIKATEASIKAMYKQAKEHLQEASDLVLKQQAIIQNTSERLANQKFDEFIKEFEGITNSKMKRLEEFCNSIPTNKGTTILEEFNKAERQLRQRMEDEWER